MPTFSLNFFSHADIKNYTISLIFPFNDDAHKEKKKKEKLKAGKKVEFVYPKKLL